MNFFSGSSVSAAMRPLFWSHFSPMNYWKNYTRNMLHCKLVSHFSNKLLTKTLLQTMHLWLKQTNGSWCANHSSNFTSSMASQMPTSSNQSHIWSTSKRDQVKCQLGFLKKRQQTCSVHRTQLSNTKKSMTYLTTAQDCTL